jgi:hypothetical protein
VFSDLWAHNAKSDANSHILPKLALTNDDIVDKITAAFSMVSRRRFPHFFLLVVELIAPKRAWIVVSECYFGAVPLYIFI